MCILFKNFPLEITLLFNISRALVVLGSVWCLKRPERHYGLIFYYRVTQSQAGGSASHCCSAACICVDPGCKE